MEVQVLFAAYTEGLQRKLKAFEIWRRRGFEGFERASSMPMGAAFATGSFAEHRRAELSSLTIRRPRWKIEGEIFFGGGPMADKQRRNILNVPGAWYVDSECISCGVCAGEAPDNFTIADDGSTAFVSKQPASPEEVAQSEAAMGSCPVQAIGNDG